MLCMHVLCLCVQLWKDCGGVVEEIGLVRQNFGRKCRSRRQEKAETL